MDSYEYGRLCKLPGAKVKITIAPSAMSSRIRLSAQRMLAAGILKGGYQSQARRLARMIAKQNGLFLLDERHGQYIELGNVSWTISDEAHAEAQKYIAAFPAAYRLSRTNDRNSASNSEYIERQTKVWVENTATLFDNLRRPSSERKRERSGNWMYLNLHEREIGDALINIVLRETPQEHKDKLKRAAALLDLTPGAEFTILEE